MSLIVFRVPFLFFVFLFPRKAGRFQDRKYQLFNSEQSKKTKRRVLFLHLYVVVGKDRITALLSTERLQTHVFTTITKILLQ